ncbi:MAG: hypothetical protein NTX64_18675 [Elusimicrobia bacterium]|nr:hypothetical protein [Elusimicrobiota bacterium]
MSGLCAPLLALALAPAMAAAPSSPWGKKAWGVLVIDAAASSDSGRGAPKLAKDLGKKFQVEFARGLADPKEIQSAVDRLTAQNVKKIVVVPLVLTTESDAMDETQYVLGLRKDPSAEFFKGAHGHSGYTNIRRVQTKLPVVMSPGLDAHRLVAEILAARAKEQSRKPARERVVLVAWGARTNAGDELTRRNLDALARKVRELGDYEDAQGFTLRDSADAKERSKAETALRRAVAAWSRLGRVIVVCHFLAPDGLERRVRAVLDGAFYSLNAKGLVSDPKLAKWIEAKAREAAAMPNMRRFKDAGRPIEPKESKKLLRLDTGAPVLRKPSTGNATGPRRTISPIDNPTSEGGY